MEDLWDSLRSEPEMINPAKWHEEVLTLRNNKINNKET